MDRTSSGDLPGCPQPACQSPSCLSWRWTLELHVHRIAWPIPGEPLEGGINFRSSFCSMYKVKKNEERNQSLEFWIWMYRQFVYVNGDENKIRMLQRKLGVYWSSIPAWSTPSCTEFYHNLYTWTCQHTWLTWWNSWRNHVTDSQMRLQTAHSYPSKLLMPWFTAFVITTHLGYLLFAQVHSLPPISVPNTLDRVW